MTLANQPTMRAATLGLFAAVFIGAGVPLMMFGRAVMQADLAIALLMALGLAYVRTGTYAHAMNAGRNIFGLALLLTATSWLPGLLHSVDPASSFKAWARSFAFIAGAGVIWALLNDNEKERALSLKAFMTISCATLGAAAISLLIWPGFVNILRGLGDVIPRPELVLKSFGATAMCLVPVLVWGGRRLGGRWIAAGLIATALAVIVIFQTSNRASIAGLMAMILVCALVLGIRDKRTRLPMLIGAPIVVAGMFAWLQIFGPSWLQTKSTYLPTWLVDPHRQMIWQFTFEHAMQAPWFGHGIDTINLLPGADINIRGMGQSYIPSHPHNWTMEILAETGWIGLSVFVATLLILAVRLARATLANQSPAVNLTLLALSTGFWTSALFNFSIWSTWWLLTYFVLFALVAAWREPKT
ncbi:O-antigen ligase family protein [Magnetovibrio sp.]|uniref:O-antigen ligase family protein n=1 Tax=Magnetovibrio sp. TaxID=2024836 RepID=UPI002F9511FF